MTVQLTADDIAKLVDAAVKGALMAQKAASAGPGGGNGHLDERHFRRVEKFDGVKGSWREFSFQFKTAVGMVNPRARSLLEDIQKAGKGVDFDIVFMDENNDDHVKKMGAELYAMLSTLVAGEALTVVRGVMGGDGWLAWSRLSVRFDPRTPAKALIAMLAVMSPKKVKETRLLAGAIEEWECRVKSLGSDHDIVLDDKIQVAVLTSLCPNEVQDLIFQWADDKARYQEIRDKVVALAQNRAGISRPVPMEVDAVHGSYDNKECEDGWSKGGWSNNESEEVEVDYVGELCLRCGGMGHYARECPTPKGKGKGGKGEVKAYGKGGYKGNDGYKGNIKGGGGGNKGYYKGNGKGKGDFKGKGKGAFMGVCWQCGDVGHRAVECQKGGGLGGAGSSMEIGAVAEDGARAVGGVWAIAAVCAEEWVDVKKGAKDRNNKYKDSRSIVCENRFRGLEEDEPSNEADMQFSRKVGIQRTLQEEGLGRKKVKFVNESGKGKYEEEGQSNFNDGVKFEDVAAVCAVPFASCCEGCRNRCPPGLEVCTVNAGERTWRRFSVGEITVDSAAEESVCPKEWCTEFGTKTPARWLKFVNASGGTMGHYGERTANFRVDGEESGVMSLSFQVSDVQKPLVAVRRITEKGNLVQFGPRESDNFIQNKATGVKIQMLKKGGSYVIPAEMLLADFPRQAQ
jgi:hypothetical protein